MRLETPGWPCRLLLGLVTPFPARLRSISSVHAPPALPLSHTYPTDALCSDPPSIVPARPLPSGNRGRDLLDHHHCRRLPHVGKSNSRSVTASPATGMKIVVWRGRGLGAYVLSGAH